MMTYKLFFILFLSFLLASLLQFLPVPEVLNAWVPEWIALVIVYWALALGERFTLILPCFIGLCLDVMNGSMLGLHAFALLLLSFVVLKNARQLRRAGRIQQMLEIGLLILGYQFIIFAIQGAVGQHINDWTYFLASATSAIIWPWVSIILGDCCQRVIKFKEE